MGRRKPPRRDQPPSSGFAPWEGERTLAEAEAEQAEEATGEAGGGDTTCPCGSTEFLLEAYLHVVDGRPKPEPVDVEGLTCPKCGREFEAVQLEGGRIVRGEFRGYAELGDDD